MIEFRPGLGALFVLTLATSAIAQSSAAPQTPAAPQAGAAPTAAAPSQQPAAQDYQLVVGAIDGGASRAGLDADPINDAGWTPLKVGDVLSRGMQVKTGPRSKVKLLMTPAEPPSVVMLERNTLVSIDELIGGQDQSGGQAVVTRIGLAYGGIRAGVAEGAVRSDLEIRSPVATLAKRGTWDFRFFSSRTGDFEISLADRGLVQAIQNATGRSVSLQRGQFVNQAMMRWVDSIRFNRSVSVQDWYGLKGAELVFNLMNQSGLGVLNPGGSQTSILNLTGKLNQQEFANLLQTQLSQFGQGGNQFNSSQQQGRGTFNPFSGLGQLGNRRRPEGDFGIGSNVIPIFIDPNSSLARRGVLRPGRMDFQRVEVQKFIAKHGR